MKHNLILLTSIRGHFECLLGVHMVQLKSCESLFKMVAVVWSIVSACLVMLWLLLMEEYHPYWQAYTDSVSQALKI